MAIKWNEVTWYSKLLALIVFVGVFVLGLYLGAAYNEAAHPAHSPIVIFTATTTQQTTTSIAPVVKNPSTSTPTFTEKRFQAYLTAYTYWDNTPPGSSDISNPIIHSKAGGTGTFLDPITLAVGHSITAGKDTLDFPAGEKFYLPYLKKYFIAEDTCGDGDTPQNGPCHTGFEGHPWLDLWIDGATGTNAASQACAAAITETHLIIENPASTYAVVPGPVFNGSCATQYSDTPLSS